MNWLNAAILSLISFGFWGFFTKLSVLHINPKSALVFQTIGVLLIGLFTLSTLNFKPEFNSKGFLYAILTGTAYSIGCWLYFIAASKGKIITVVTMTALYPLVTILLSYLLLQETVSLKQIFGIVFSFVAIFLLSS